MIRSSFFAQRDAMLGGKTLRALGDKIDVRAVAQNLARRPDRIAQMLDASDTAGAQG